MVVQGYNSTGLKKYRNADTELYPRHYIKILYYIIISKGNTPPNAISELKFALHFSLASSGLERHQRNCCGVLSLYSLNIDIPKVICLNSIGLQ